MSNIAISVENLGKCYQIGELEDYYTLRDSLTNLIKYPYKLISKNGRNKKKSEIEFIWALKDINFEVKQGEIVGIIGRNGAGKSTLLKVLSRITTPTEGKVKINGRVGSLLEVGTGFHPELTGRENIFLNGSILGMSKKEIERKFDEIVDFAEVEKFLDTPVKRYSSGMYVRLAFAVAAHMEPEILVVDEVLAVGDMIFQKKCLGKIGDISKEGRTVLFVSHNMSAISQICEKTILLNNGKINSFDNTNKVIELYSRNSKSSKKNNIGSGNKKIEIIDCSLFDKNREEQSTFYINDSIYIELKLKINTSIKFPVIAFHVDNHFGETFAHILNLDEGFIIEEVNPDHEIKLKIIINNINFNAGIYSLSIWVGENMFVACDFIKNYIDFELIQGPSIQRPTNYPANVKVFLKTDWQEIN